MAEVFISYAREDQGFARDIHVALQKVNRDTWIDWRSIPDSAKWRAEIFAAIEAADNFLFVISPDSVKSWMCGQEVNHAEANGKRLKTVLYRPVDGKDLLPVLADIQWIDYPGLGF
jgi:TIR domain